MSDELTLGEMGNHAAGVLPEGWEIRLCVHRHAGWVELRYEGVTVEYPSNRETIEESWADALELAAKAEMFVCPRCGYPSPWVDGTDTEVWCQTCGEEFAVPKEVPGAG